MPSAAVRSGAVGERVGVPWLGWTDQVCDYCRSGHENLCDHARFTGYTLDGGYAEFCLVDERFCLSLPPQFDDLNTPHRCCAPASSATAVLRAPAMRGASGCMDLAPRHT